VIRTNYNIFEQMKTIANTNFPESFDKTIRRLKRKHKPTSHGNKVWNSNLIMIDYLTRYRLDNIDTALDIGCGWGVLCAYLCKQQIDVQGLDIDENLAPYIEHVNTINDTSFSVDYQDYKDISSKQWQSYDLITGCDICFWEEQIDSILNMIDKASGVVLISDPGRYTFWHLCKQVAGNLHDITIYTPRKAQGYVLEIVK